MGIIAIPFALDIKKVKSVFGSKDKDLFEKIKAAHLYNHYSSQADDYNFDNALEDIIFKYIEPASRKAKSSFLGLGKSKPDTGLNEKIAHGYGYVSLVICDYFGTHLLPSCDGIHYGRDFEEAFEIMKEKGLQSDLSDMFEQHEVFDIPAIADFPSLKHFTKSEIEHVTSVMDKIEINESQTDFESDDFDEVQVMLNNIKYCFNFCQEHGLEMVTFTH